MIKTLLINIFRSVDKENQQIKKYEALKITNFIHKLIESINKALGVQMFCTVFILLLFGILTAYSFISTSSKSIFPTSRLVTILIYLHLVLVEISYYGSATYNEVCMEDNYLN